MMVDKWTEDDCYAKVMSALNNCDGNRNSEFFQSIGAEEKEKVKKSIPEDVSLIN